MLESAIRSVVLPIFCCLPFVVAAQQDQRSSIEREHFLAGQFKVVSKTGSIPSNIKQEFSKVAGEPSFAMADPRQKFQSTDVVRDRTLPWRRLLFAGVQDGKWFVHYEHGGYAHTFYVIAFKVDPHGDAHFLWGCGVGRAKTLEQLRRMVGTCQLPDEETYW